MKRKLTIAYLLLVTLLFLTVNSLAEDKTVIYISGSGLDTNSGATVVEPVATFAKAYELIGDNEGIIVVSGDVNINTNDSVTFPSSAKKITVTGKDPTTGMVYETAVRFMPSNNKKQIIQFTSAIEFNNLTMDRNTSNKCTELWTGPSLTLGENMAFTWKGGAIDTNADGRIGVRLGNASTVCDSAELTMTSGTLSFVHGGNNKNTVTNSTINFGGTAGVTLFVQAGGTDKNVTTTNVNITGGTIPILYVGGYGSGVTMTSNVTVSGGIISAITGMRNQSGSGGIGTANITWDGVVPVGLALDSTMSGGTAAHLTLKNMDCLTVTDTLDGWGSLSLVNSFVLVSADYAGPASVSVDGDSKLLLSASVNTESDLPANTGSGVIALDEPLSVVYVNGTVAGSGYGDTAARAVKTFDEAFARLADTGGTIVLCGDTSVKGTVNFPAKSGKVTITALDPVTNTNTGAVFVIDSSAKTLILCDGNIEFNNLKINRINNGSGSEFWSGPSLTFGEGVTVTNAGGAVGSNQIDIRGGYYSKDCDSVAITVQSGSFSWITGGNNRYAVGTAVINISSETKIAEYVSGGGTSQNVTSSVINISGGTVPILYVNGYGAASLGSSDINITGGTISKIRATRTDVAVTGKITGDVDLSISEAVITDVALSDITIEGKKRLTLDQMTDVTLQTGFADWDSVSITGSSLICIADTFVKPDTLTVETGSKLVLNSKKNSALPEYTGGGTVVLESVYSGKTYDEELLTSFTSSYNVQGTAAYEDYIIQLGHKGGGVILKAKADGTFENLGEVKLASYNTGSPTNAYGNHCNQAMFGSTKFDESDPFPLLFVTTSNSGGMDESGYIGHCAVERVLYSEEKGWYGELVQTIKFNDHAYTGATAENGYTSTIPFANGKYAYYDNADTGFTNTEGYEKVAWGAPAYFVDSNPTSATSGKFYIFSARFRTKNDIEQQLQAAGTITSYAEDNAYIITQFDMPTLPTSTSDPNYGGTTTLTPTDITDQFATEYDIYITQGGTMYQGRIYYSYGFGGSSVYTYNAIRVFDVAQKKIIGKIDLSGSAFANVEPECCFVYQGKLGLSIQTKKLYLFDYVESLFTPYETATCQTAGSERTFDCLSGATIRVNTLATDPTNHAGGIRVENKKDATYAEGGYTGDTYCQGCNKKLATGTTTDKLVAVVLPAEPSGPAESSTKISMSFVDVAEKDWFYDEIAYVYQNRLMGGIGGNQFNPNGTTTRAMVWMTLGRLADADVDDSTGRWYDKARSWAVTAGVSDGTNANGNITREQLVTMLYRFVDSPDVDTSDLALLSGFADCDSISVYAEQAMAWAVSTGIIQGSDNVLRPRDTASRAEMAAILMRFDQYRMFANQTVA